MAPLTQITVANDGIIKNITCPAGFANTGTSLNSLTAGNYNYTVTDTSGDYPASGTIAITEPAQVTVTANATNVSVSGGNDGQITGTTSAGATYACMRQNSCASAVVGKPALYHITLLWLIFMILLP